MSPEIHLSVMVWGKRKWVWHMTWVRVDAVCSTHVRVGVASGPKEEEVSMDSPIVKQEWNFISMQTKLSRRRHAEDILLAPYYTDTRSGKSNKIILCYWYV